MNNIPDDPDEVICTCSGTTKAKILQLIAKGVDDIDKIASATGAVTGCGSCDATIQDIITEQDNLN